jgi:hypothetical protein
MCIGVIGDVVEREFAVGGLGIPPILFGATAVD